MARSLRMYGKKRGNRHTGSRRWGSLGEALFFGFFLVLGSFFLSGLVNMLVVPEWRVNHEFVETEGIVLMTQLGEPTEQEIESPLYRPEVLVEYEAGGKHYKKWTYDIHFRAGREFSNDRAAGGRCWMTSKPGKRFRCGTIRPTRSP